MNTQEIKSQYLKLHDELGIRKDATNKSQYDIDHTKIWTDMDEELKVRKAELKNIKAPTMDEQSELKDLLIRFPEFVYPLKRDLAKELDDLKADHTIVKADVATLKGTVK
jgi:hypothetical protein